MSSWGASVLDARGSVQKVLDQFSDNAWDILNKLFISMSRAHNLKPLKFFLFSPVLSQMKQIKC